MKTAMRWMVALWMMALVGCVIDPEVPGQDLCETQLEQFRQPERGHLEVLLVLDNSLFDARWSGAQERGLSQLFALHKALSGHYRVRLALLSTKAAEAGRCSLPSRQLLDPGAASLGSFLQKARAVVQEAPNKGIEAALSLLQGQLGRKPLCDHGFPRRGSQLEIFFLTARRDRSPQLDVSRAFRGLKGSFVKVRIHAIAGPPQARCEGLPSTPRPWQLTQAFDGIQVPICERGWGLDPLPSISSASSRVLLCGVPDPNSLSVTFDDLFISSQQYQFNAKDNALEFRTPPPPGTAIRVGYKRQCQKAARCALP